MVEKKKFSPLPLFVFYFHFFFEKILSRRLQGQKNHKYWVPSFGEFYVLSSVKSLGTKAALLSSASRLCHNLNARSNGRMYP